MIGTPDQDAFVSKNKWAVVTTVRKDGSPSSSVIFYVRDGDEILFSTMKSRVKAKSLLRDPRIAVAVLDEGAPYGFVTIEGTGRVIDGDTTEEHKRIYKTFRGADYVAPADLAEQLARDGRVIVRVTAERVSGVPNRG